MRDAGIDIHIFRYLFSRGRSKKSEQIIQCNTSQSISNDEAVKYDIWKSRGMIIWNVRDEGGTVLHSCISSSDHPCPFLNRKDLKTSFTVPAVFIFGSDKSSLNPNAKKADLFLHKSCNISL